MLALNLIELFVDLLLEIVRGVDDLFAHVVGGGLGAVLQIVALWRLLGPHCRRERRLRCLLRYPKFLGDAFDLLGCASVG